MSLSFQKVWQSYPRSATVRRRGSVEGCMQRIGIAVISIANLDWHWKIQVCQILTLYLFETFKINRNLEFSKVLEAIRSDEAAPNNNRPVLLICFVSGMTFNISSKFFQISQWISWHESTDETESCSYVSPCALIFQGQWSKIFTLPITLVYWYFFTSSHYSIWVSQHE